ncbi:hypothetical protein [Nicoliella lavandulae]|uniref:Uncharacterized protein n=1 Tax=Nicoliella lavandulae TaxID=3082954 RepID=A0ABU8SKH8_9LACO
MSSRTKRMFMIDLKNYFKGLCIFLLIFAIVFMVLPYLINGFSGHGWTASVFSNDLGGFLSGLVLLFTGSLMAGNFFENSFTMKMQNGFSRSQIFKNNITLIGFLSILLVLFNIIINPNQFLWLNVYKNFFKTSIIDYVLFLLISILLNYLVISLFNFLGAFFNLFSKKIRKWVVLIFFVGWTIAIIALTGFAVRGVIQLISAHWINRDTLISILEFTMTLLFGYRNHGPYNPINLIITLTVINGLISLLTRFVTLRLTIHRN